jgi:hypothetical protein
LLYLGALAFTFVLSLLLPVRAELIEITARPSAGNTVFWSQLGTPNLTLTSPQSFTSIGGISGTVSSKGSLSLVEQCCVGLTGTFNGNFAPGDIVLSSSSPLTINFKTPVQTVGAQIQGNIIGDVFTAEIQAFHGKKLLGTFTETGSSGDVGNNSDIFLGVQDTKSNITRVAFEIFDSSGSQTVAINQMSVGSTKAHGVPGPLAGGGLFPLGLGAAGLVYWLVRRSRGIRNLKI